jgi:bifunctional non-homologous end joining protein LigD
MTLTDYSKKRDFIRTPDPSGARPAPPSASEPRRFVIQKHAAASLHYDFRLQMRGTIKSWTVPKGIPFKQGDKHLAVQVEDHPADDTGIIAPPNRGHDGPGSVTIWDQGTYEAPDGNPAQALAAGKLRIRLHGAKLEGEWTLIRTRMGDEKTKPEWLLIKTGAELQPDSGREDESAIVRQIMEGFGLVLDARWDPAIPLATMALMN